MFKHIIRRSAFVLAGSAVAVSSIETNNANSEKTFWSNLVPSFFSADKSSLAEDADVKNEQNLTGWDRLYIMYSKDEYGHLSKELNALLSVTYYSFFIGSFYGIVTKTKEAHKTFIERNQATQFENVFRARRELQDKVLIAAFKGVMQNGVRLAFFTGGILTLTFSLMVYCNYSSVLFYGIAGGTLGSIHRWKTGPRGMLVGGAVGGILGLLGGGMTKGLLYLFDITMDDFILFHHEAMVSRDMKWKEIQMKAIEDKIEMTPMLKERDEIIKNAEGDKLFEKKVSEDKPLQQKEESKSVKK